ncbi:MAG: S41 family peptidase, partial [Oscillospiraceae bacterium]
KSNSTEIERNNLAIPITFFYSDPSYNFYPMRTDRKYMSQEIDNDTYFIQLNEFYEDSNPNLQDFNQKVSNDFEKSNYKKLIIDLRYNPGGYGSIFDDLFNTIIKNYNKNKFDVYTLIGAKSASASILNAYRIEELFPNNTFVGTPPCQKPNFNAPVLEYYDYKNILGIEMVYSYGCYICDPKNPDALYPDITIEETLDDWLNSYDRVLETVVSMPIDEEKLKTYPNANIDFSDFKKWGKEGSIKVIFDKEDMKKWIGE